jgi:RNase adapter protein RapZ
MTDRVPQVVVITGLSGAGKSTALRTLSDLGFYCVDNLPPSVVAETVRVCDAGGVLPVALGLDVRVGAFLDEAVRAIEALTGASWRLIVLFLDAADDVLVRRFSETRRPHPLLAGRSMRGEDEEPTGPDSMSVLDGVQLERERLAGLRSRSDLVLDTSQMSVHDLRREVIERFGHDHEARPTMVTRFVSFGFKYGVPLDADLIFDVRFLDNPHFVREMRDKPGTEPLVRDFVLRSPGCEELLGHLERLLLFALPNYEREGKSYLTVGIGCTGGRHRSVAVAVALSARLSAQGRFRLVVVHRDLGRDATAPPPPRSVPDTRPSGPGGRDGPGGATE